MPTNAFPDNGTTMNPYGSSYYLPVQSYWTNNTTAASTVMYAPVYTGAVPQVLSSVIDARYDLDLRADRPLGPLEWLREQIDDVCRIAQVA